VAAQRNAGQNSDAYAIFDEVERICENEPSKHLIDAVMRVYFDFGKLGK